MSLISKLRNYFPENWDEVSIEDYDEAKYKLRCVEKNSAEYLEVMEPFRDITTINFHVERIQYPATYLRYQMKSELDIGFGVNHNTKYLLIKKSALNLAIKFNCDVRRDGVNGESVEYTIKKKINTTDDAYLSDVVLVVYEFRVMGKYDDDQYPTYAITFSRD